MSIASTAGLASSASRISENEFFSLLFAFAAGFFAFISTWGTRRNLNVWVDEMNEEAPVLFFWSILGIGLFIAQLAYDPQWQNIFIGAAFASSLLGPIAIVQTKRIREIQYDPIADYEE